MFILAKPSGANTSTTESLYVNPFKYSLPVEQSCVVEVKIGNGIILLADTRVVLTKGSPVKAALLFKVTYLTTPVFWVIEYVSDPDPIGFSSLSLPYDPGFTTLTVYLSIPNLPLLYIEFSEITKPPLTGAPPFGQLML